mmetsp:Transcript_29968/g.62633  ORF Transcript_29968/g.62633 Transcript_29968/m.62633 type:complete len:94 (-) Transcript_29968:409-690(-)
MTLYESSKHEKKESWRCIFTRDSFNSKRFCTVVTLSRLRSKNGVKNNNSAFGLSRYGHSVFAATCAISRRHLPRSQFRLGLLFDPLQLEIPSR